MPANNFRLLGRWRNANTDNFKWDELKPLGLPFVLQIVSAPVVEDRTGSQRTLQESVALHVMYERKGTHWKELTDTVTYFIAKDSLPICICMVEKVLFHH